MNNVFSGELGKSKLSNYIVQKSNIILRVVLRFIVSTLIFFLPCIHTFGQPRESLELLSEILVSSSYYDIEIVENRLFAASGHGIEIFNITDHENPQLIRRIPTPGISIELAVSSNVLYVSDSFRGLYAFDVSNIENIYRTWILEDIEGDTPYCLDLKIYNKRNDIRHLNWWKNQIGAYSLSEVSSGLIVETRDKLKSPKHSNSTVNRYMTSLAHSFTIAVNEWEWIEDNPFRKIKKLKEPRGRIRYLLEAEKSLLLKFCMESSSPRSILCSCALSGDWSSSR